MTRDLKDYFNSVADVLAAKAVLAGDSAENADIGANRELICRELLAHHIPRRYGVYHGGDVFGAGRTRSGQIDVLITHDMSMNFMENHRVRCPVESLTAAISVKSRLTKAELFNALSNLATIPQCHEPAIRLGLLTKPVTEFVLSWPSTFVFAFDGVSLETCLLHINEFYTTHSVPFNRIPRAIIVNRKYIIVFLHYDVPGANIATVLNPAHLRASAATEPTRGAPLFWLMHELAKGVTWLSDMYLDYAVYYDEAYGHQ